MDAQPFGPWTTFIILSSTLILLAIIYIRRKFTYWERLGIKSVPGSFPFGSFGDFFRQKFSILELTSRFYNEGKGEKYIGFYFSMKPVLIVRDLDLVKNVLLKDFSNFSDRGIHYNEKDDPLSANLFSLDEEKWKPLRSKMSPTFTSGKMKIMFNTMKLCNDQLLDYVEYQLKTSSDVDASDLTKRYALNSIAQTSFGIGGHNMKEDNDFSRHAFIFSNPDFALVLRVMIAFLWKGLAKFLNLRIHKKEVADYYTGAVNEIMDYRERTETRRNDFMQILMDLKNAPDDGSSMTLSNNDVIAQAFMFIVAGYETTSSVLSFMLFEMAANPEIQDRLAKEIDDAGKIEDLTYEKLHEMKYLDMCFEESLRKHPPVSDLQRVSKKDYRLPGGKTLEAGTTVYVPVKGIQSDPEYFPDPEKFNPERFNKENPAHSVLQYSHIPFGDGPRYCIGIRFAKLQSKLAIFALLSKYRFEISDKLTLPMKLEPARFIPHVMGGMWLRMIKRRTD